MDALHCHQQKYLLWPVVQELCASCSEYASQYFAFGCKCSHLMVRLETGCTPVLLPHMSMGWPFGGPKHDKAWCSTYGRKLLTRIRPIWLGYPVASTAHKQNYGAWRTPLAKSVLLGLQGTKQSAHVGPKTEAKGSIDKTGTEFHGRRGRRWSECSIRTRCAKEKKKKRYSQLTRARTEWNHRLGPKATRLVAASCTATGHRSRHPASVPSACPAQRAMLCQMPLPASLRQSLDDDGTR